MKLLVSLNVSKHVAWMILALRRYVRRVGLVLRVKLAQVNALMVHANKRTKSNAIAPHAHQAGTVPFRRGANVLHVNASAHVPEVINAIVQAATVFVVNVLCRPFSMHVKPREAVGVIEGAVEINPEISITANCSYGAAVAAGAARKQPGQRVVMQNFTQTFWSKLRRSHTTSCLGQVVRAGSALQRCSGPLILSLALSSCSTIQQYKNEQRAKLAPTPLFSSNAKAIIDTHCASTMRAAQTDTKAIPAWVDACSAVAAMRCGDWLMDSASDSRAESVGLAKAGVLQNAVTAALGLAKAGASAVAAWGLGATTYEGLKDVDRRAMSAPSTYTVQTTLMGMIADCNQQLARDAKSLSFGQAFTRLESCARSCAPEAAAAASTNALARTTTTVDPTSGALTTTAVTSAAIKDDSGARLLAFWRPGGTVDRAAEARIKAWMLANGIEASIPFLANSALYAAARAKAVADLGIGQ